MKHEPAIDGASLLGRVREAYAAPAERLEFVPKGEVSLCYVGHCGGGTRYFLKLCDNSRLGRLSASRFDI